MAFSGTPGEVAVGKARTCLGTPYRFGGFTCGSGIDCSGLTMVAWAAAGVKLPHSSAAQAALTGAHPTPQSSWLPGDLLFYFHPVHHVAIYAGQGRIITANHPGSRVMYAQWNEPGPYIGTGRPKGGTTPGGSGGGPVQETSPLLGGAGLPGGCLVPALLLPLGYGWLWGRR